MNFNQIFALVLCAFSFSAHADTCMFQKDQELKAGSAVGLACPGFSGFTPTTVKPDSVKLSVLDANGKTFSFEIKQPTENLLIYAPESLLMNSDVMGWLKENKVDVKSISTIQVESMEIPTNIQIFSDRQMTLPINRISGKKTREWNCVYKEPPLVVEAPACAGKKMCVGYVQCLKRGSEEVKDYATSCLSSDTACPSANDCADADNTAKPVVTTRVLGEGEVETSSAGGTGVIK